jgi:membrane-bound lytic murein transglycosylase D
LKNLLLPVKWIKSHLWISGLFAFGFVLLLLGFFCESKEKTAPDSTSVRVCTAYIPEELTFCDEPVPLKYFDVRESLEREVIINSYYHSQTILFLKKGKRYFDEIDPILKANNIPEDFKYLMAAESGFQDIVSPAGAAGQWHFLEATAREYGLEVNDEVDERYNLSKSTDAACKYFNESYAIYKNWTLVAASYNGGRRGVDRQIEKQGETSFYNLLFAEETARYIYRILAIKLVFENPGKYGFNLSKSEIYPLITYKEIKVDSTITDMGTFAKELGINYKLLKILNPWLRDRKLTNPQKRAYTLRIPLENSREIY